MLSSVTVEDIEADDEGTSLLHTLSPSNTPRNKSPMTVQERVGSLPFIPVEAAKIKY